MAEKDGSGRDWNQIRQALSDCVVERTAAHRMVARGRFTGFDRKSPRSACTSSKENPARRVLSDDRYLSK